MRLVRLVFLFTLLAPGSVFAASFAKESLFLSRSPVIEGDTVYIHAVIANDAASTFKGEVVFEDNDERIGTVAVTIAPGGAETASLSWQPFAGTHPISAELMTEDSTVVEKLSATFIVRTKPMSETTAPSSIEPSDGVREVIAGISPQAAEVAEPIFSTIDTLRQKGVKTLEKGIVWARSGNEGEVAGAQSGIADTVLGVVKTALIYLMELVRWLLSNAGVFYPVLALTFLYLLWRTYKRLRRPSYE